MNKAGTVAAQALLLLMIGASLIAVKPAVAQSISKPSVPEFTIKCVAASYSTTTTDPYTDQTTTTQHLNRTIQLTVTNQPAIDSSHLIYYNIRIRPHFEGNWTELYPIWKGPNAPYNWDTKTWAYSEYLCTQEIPLRLQTPIQSSSQYTTITLPLDENPRYELMNLPDNAQVDFQVEAIIGHNSKCWAIQHPLTPEYGGYYVDAVAYDSDSGWSGTQTINLADSSVITLSTPSPTSFPTPTLYGSSLPTAASTQSVNNFVVPQLNWLEVAVFAVLGVVVALLVVFIVLLRRRIRVLELKHIGT